MARQPKQVHIFLYRKKGNEYEYAVFQRADMPFCWQGVCGGAEGDETLEEAAYRETLEEAGITEHLPIYQLESVSYLPSNIFSNTARNAWGNEVVVVPMYFFAIPFDGEIQLSDEHSDVKWLSYNDAYNMIYFKDQQVALYELNEKLLRNIIKS